MANQLLTRIDKLVKQLNELQPLKAEDQIKLDKKFRLEFNYNSNHIEGNTLTYGETELLLFFGKTTGDHDIREYEEMEAHDAALKLIREWAADKTRTLSEVDIKNLNKVLLVKPYWSDAITPDGNKTRRLIKVGDYKVFPNSVRLKNGEIFHYASVEETPIKMKELIDWYKNEEHAKSLTPIELAALLHYRFVRIHPFDDGNGRVSRLLMNYVLLKNNLPPVIIKSSDKENYLFALNKADVGDLSSFIGYIAEQLIWSLELNIKAAKGEDIEEDTDWQKRISLLKKTTRDQTLIIKKNQTIINDLLLKTILPTLEKIIHDLAIIEDLFLESRILFGSKTQQQVAKNIPALIKKYTQIPNSNLLDFYLKYELNGYKYGGTNTFNISIEYYWQFDNYKVIFMLDHNNFLNAHEILYNESYSKSDMESFSNESGKILSRKIEENLKNNKN